MNKIASPLIRGRIKGNNSTTTNDSTEDTLSRYFKDKVNARFNSPWFSVSSDIITTEEKVILPWENTTIKVTLNRSNFDNFKNFHMSSWYLRHMHYSTRSCYAQSWVNIFGIWLVSEEQIKILESWWNITLTIFIRNSWFAKIKIPEWVWLFRFFNTNRLNNTIRWAELYKEIKSWKIQIDWEYGSSWYLMDKEWNELKESDYEKAERLILPLTNKRFLPITDDIVEVRTKKDLPKVLKTIWDLHDYGFEIWETNEVTLPHDIVLVIEEWVYENWSRHISSPLIDPLFSWPIRTEITWENRIQFIELMAIRT